MKQENPFKIFRLNAIAQKTQIDTLKAFDYIYQFK